MEDCKYITESSAPFCIQLCTFLFKTVFFVAVLERLTINAKVATVLDTIRGYSVI
jgi:hypothetical protein